MELGLKDKVAIVTGSGRGIGAVTARALAEEGAKVVITDIDPQTTKATCAALVADGYNAIGVACDVTQETQVETLVLRTVEAFGAVHILVNNAGFPRDNYITKMPEQDWDAVVGVILKGAYTCSRAVVPYFMEQKWGRVINISSRAYLGNPGQTNYAAAKAGIIGFSKSLAKEIGSRGVTVNVVAPGFIDTDMTKALPEEARTALIGDIALERLGSPEDIAHAVAFLASPAAGYITGETLHVNGGMYMP